MTDGLKTRSIKGVLWSATESVGVAILSLGSFIILARILEPGDIGAVALASAFIIIFNLIIAYGFVDAIVLQLRLTPEHLDTGFWSTLGTAILLCLLCTLGADTAAQWLNEPKLAVIMPWLSTLLIVNSLGAVPIAIFRRDLRFRTLAICNVSGRAIGAVASVIMALTGFGLWSLVGQQLIAAVISSAAVVIAARWRPHFRFSLQRLREMGEFGFHVSTSQVISALGEQMMNLLVGSMFGTVILGHFSVAWRMVQLVRALIASAIAADPALIIADEPTTALDVTVQRQILDLIDSQVKQGGRSLLLVTHDLGVVAQYCHRVVVMKSGRVVETGLVADVFTNPTHEYTKQLLDAVPPAPWAQEAPGLTEQAVTSR